MTGRTPWAVRQLAPAGRQALWAAIRVAGRDMTAEAAQRSCLVLAPHPDDETLGCGATILRRRRAGTQVTVLFATDGQRSSHSSQLAPAALGAVRAEEAVAALAVLGVAEGDIVRLGMQDTMLDRAGARLVEGIAATLDAVRPDDVLVTAAGDPHPDHAALARAARLAVAAVGRPVRIWEYPIWQWRAPSSWRAFSGRRPHLVSTRGHLDAKRSALAAHRSQLENITGEAEWWSLDQRFLRNFFRSHEVFFPVPAADAGDPPRP